MGSSNGPLILYYALVMVITAAIWWVVNKKWWVGLIVGFFIALVGITVFALLMGG